MAAKKIAAQLQKEIEQVRAEMQRGETEDPGRKEKAQAENTEASWQVYFEWRGYFKVRQEELQKLEKRMEGLKKFVEEETRKEAEAARVVDEEDEDEKDQKNQEKLKVLETWNGTHTTWKVGEGMGREATIYWKKGTLGGWKSTMGGKANGRSGGLI